MLLSGKQPYKKTRFLIVTRDFGSNFWIPGFMLRAVELGNYLVRRGHDVHVVCAARKNSYDRVEVDPRIQIHPVSFGSVDWEAESVTQLQRITRKAVRAKDLLFHPFRRIDAAAPSLPRLQKAIVSLVQSAHIDVAIVSSPPHSLQLLVPILKARFGERLKVISDFRDPWTTALRYRPKSQSTLRKYQCMERTVAMASDLYVTVTDGMADSLEMVTGRRPIVVENGYSQLKYFDGVPSEEVASFVKKCHSENRVVFGFFGSGRYSDPEIKGKNLAALVDVIAEDSTLIPRFALVIQGAIKLERSWPQNIPVLNMSAASNTEVVANMQQVDVGVAIYTEFFDAPLVMGGKIYDYVRADIPIWLITTANATSQRQFIYRYPGKAVFSAVDRPGELQQALENFLNEADSLGAGSSPIPETQRFLFSRESQYDALLNEVGRLFSQ